MTSSRTVFVGTPAFLGRIDGVTRCAFWTDEPVKHDFDPGMLISLDLARTPSAAATNEITWADVDVDDCFHTDDPPLGPAWPDLHLTGGALHLATAFIDRLPPALRPAPAANGGPYESQSVVYWPDTTDPRAGNRYAGHCAELLEQRGTLARLAVYPPGRSTDPATSPVTMWLDLGSPEHCDAGPDSLTTVGGTVTRGALFLIAGRLPSPG
jgi:hypothetical protein